MEMVPILYCLWDGDNTDRLDRFLESLASQTLEGYELVIVCKTNKPLFSRDVTRTVEMHRISCAYKVWTTADTGFYFSAYLAYIQMYKPEFVILLSSDSIVMNDDWANLLINPLRSGETLLCGAMASRESIKSSQALCDNLKIAMLAAPLNREFESFTIHFNLNGGSRFHFVKYFTASIVSVIFKQLNLKCKEILYSKLISLKEKRMPRVYRGFKDFPNPHIRGTGLALTSQLFLDTLSSPTYDALHGCQIESGINSFTQTCLDQGSLPLVYVGGGWVEITSDLIQQTFRSNSGFIPLVVDEHFAQFQESTQECKNVLDTLTWKGTQALVNELKTQSLEVNSR